MSNVVEKQAVVEKYIQREKNDQEWRREAARLKKLHMLESCAALDLTRRGSRGRKHKHKAKDKLRKASNKNARFSDFQGDTSTEQDARNFQIDDSVPDVSLNKLSKTYGYDLSLLKDPEALRKEKLKQHESRRRSSVKHRHCRHTPKLVGFSFLRSQMLKDSDLPTRRRNTDLMQLRLSQFGVRLSAVEGKGPRPQNLLDKTGVSELRRRSRRSKFLHPKHIVTGKPSKRDFKVADEALEVARSKARLDLTKDKSDCQIQLASGEIDSKNLDQFKFEFADPRLTAKQASVRLRAELLKLLQRRHIPTAHRMWPLEIRGAGFTAKNPYGRVILNYTRLAHHEKEQPHTAYRILLTNIGYIRNKQHKMLHKHFKNMIELEEELNDLEVAVEQVKNDIIQGLQIWASLCGTSVREKRHAEKETKQFIEQFQNVYQRLLTNVLVDLYRIIQATEFALRRLSISEGKGEGAELHEFKDIMRCREKLKAVHKSVQESIEKYQSHSKEVLEAIHKTDRKLSGLTIRIGSMNMDMKVVTKAVTTMIDGMYFCQHLALRNQQKERLMQDDMGILVSERLTNDYDKMMSQLQETRMKKIELQRQYNAHIRETHKMLPLMRWR